MEAKELNETVERARVALANANWDASKHPRGPGGRFGNGTGGKKDESEIDLDEYSRRSAASDHTRRSVKLDELDKKNGEDNYSEEEKRHMEEAAESMRKQREKQKRKDDEGYGSSSELDDEAKRHFAKEERESSAAKKPASAKKPYWADSIQRARKALAKRNAAKKVETKQPEAKKTDTKQPEAKKPASAKPTAKKNVETTQQAKSVQSPTSDDIRMAKFLKEYEQGMHETDDLQYLLGHGRHLTENQLDEAVYQTKKRLNSLGLYEWSR